MNRNNYVDPIGVMFHWDSVKRCLHDEEEIRSSVKEFLPRNVEDTEESIKKRVDEIIERLERNHYVSVSSTDEICIFKAYH